MMRKKRHKEIKWQVSGHRVVSSQSRIQTQAVWLQSLCFQYDTLLIPQLFVMESNIFHSHSIAAIHSDFTTHKWVSTASFKNTRWFLALFWIWGSLGLRSQCRFSQLSVLIIETREDVWSMIKFLNVRLKMLLCQYQQQRRKNNQFHYG